ncbi:hypothetical protein [Paenibacillus sp. P46E]|uniref:hypothetical protein n=1 Tax=Paenibacillus sp. P46E TaxID=1349436 RepID=UPI00093F9141|nr:hypothetical protein [Paenibacillus sp. P46E]OKP95149.1 hypothetical protein A3849_27440 [Paenibacillus sp. P46E]
MDLLRLCEIAESRGCQIEIDYYVPFSAQIGDCYDLVNENIVYWRTGDIESSLIEFGIGSNTGVLKKVTLTAVGNAVLSDVIIKNNKIEDGTPVFDNSIIPQKGIYDYIKDFQVFLGKSTITAIIGKIDECNQIVRLGRMNIGFDYEKYVTHVSINNLTIEEHKELKESLKL